jgi:hypothetical protein
MKILSELLDVAKKRDELEKHQLEHRQVAFAQAKKTGQPVELSSDCVEVDYGDGEGEGMATVTIWALPNGKTERTQVNHY